MTGSGYGGFWLDGKTLLAHRVAFELLVQEPDDTLVIDHTCRNRICCNPAHLQPVTNQENILRGDTFQSKNAVKTHCPQGHPYDEDNTYKSRKGSRMCRECGRERQRRARVGHLGRALVPEQVAEIRLLLGSGEKVSVIAKKYGVNRHTISDIKSGKTWREV